MSIATIQSPIFNFFGIDLSLSESVKHPPNTRHPQVDFRESYDRIIVLQLMVSLRNPRRDHLQKGLDQLDDTYFAQLCKDLGLTQRKSSVLLFVVKGNDHVFELGAC